MRRLLSIFAVLLTGCSYYVETQIEPAPVAFSCNTSSLEVTKELTLQTCSVVPGEIVRFTLLAETPPLVVSLSVLDSLGEQLHEAQLPVGGDAAISFMVPHLGLANGSPILIVVKEVLSGNEIARFETQYSRLLVGLSEGPALHIALMPPPGQAAADVNTFTLPDEPFGTGEMRVVLSDTGRFAAVGRVSTMAYGYREASPADIVPTALRVYNVMNGQPVAQIPGSVGIDRAYFVHNDGVEQLLVPALFDDLWSIAALSLGEEATIVPLTLTGKDSFAAPPLFVAAGMTIVLGDNDGISSLYDNGVTGEGYTSEVALYSLGGDWPAVTRSCAQLSGSVDRSFPRSTALFRLHDDSLQLVVQCVLPPAGLPLDAVSSLSSLQLELFFDPETGAVTDEVVSDPQAAPTYMHDVRRVGDWLRVEYTITGTQGSSYANWQPQETGAYLNVARVDPSFVPGANTFTVVSSARGDALFYYSTRYVDDAANGGYNISLYGSGSVPEHQLKHELFYLTPIENSTGYEGLIADPSGIFGIPSLAEDSWVPVRILSGSFHVAVVP